MTRISERLMDTIENADSLTEVEINQNIELCEEDIIDGLEDIARALRILRAIRKGDAKTLASMQYGF